MNRLMMNSQYQKPNRTDRNKNKPDLTELRRNSLVSLCFSNEDRFVATAGTVTRNYNRRRSFQGLVLN